MRLQLRIRRFTHGHGRLASLFTAGLKRISNCSNSNAFRSRSSYCTDLLANRLEVLDEVPNVDFNCWFGGGRRRAFAVSSRTGSESRNPNQNRRKTRARNKDLGGAAYSVGRSRLARRLERCHEYAVAAADWSERKGCSLGRGSRRFSKRSRVSVEPRSPGRRECR